MKRIVFLVKLGALLVVLWWGLWQIGANADFLARLPLGQPTIGLWAYRIHDFVLGPTTDIFRTQASLTDKVVTGMQSGERVVGATGSFLNTVGDSIAFVGLVPLLILVAAHGLYKGWLVPMLARIWGAMSGLFTLSGLAAVLILLGLVGLGSYALGVTRVFAALSPLAALAPLIIIVVLVVVFMGRITGTAGNIAAALAKFTLVVGLAATVILMYMSARGNPPSLVFSEAAQNPAVGFLFTSVEALGRSVGIDVLNVVGLATFVALGFLAHQVYPRPNPNGENNGGKEE